MKGIIRMLRNRKKLEEPLTGLPSSLLQELSEMGVIEASVNFARPVNMNIGEIEKARWLAKHGHWAFINTSR